MNRSGRVLVLSFVLSALLAACGSTATPPSAPLSPAPELSSGTSGSASTQRSDGGQVTVEATWAGPAAGGVFDVKLDTHSVDLDSLDLSGAILRNDRGETLPARPWAAPAGGHHREGKLTFGGDASGFLAGATWIELVLTGVGDVPERVLRWRIGP